MAAEVRHFSPETVKDMQVAIDLAWSSLSAEQQAQSSKGTLATRILDAAEAAQPRTIPHVGADVRLWPLADIPSCLRLRQ